MNASLDSLLGDVEPMASFHDAQLIRLRIDFKAATLEADFSICVGDPDAPLLLDRRRWRSGCLRLSGVRHWSLEPSLKRKWDRPLVDR